MSILSVLSRIALVAAAFAFEKASSFSRPASSFIGNSIRTFRRQSGHFDRCMIMRDTSASYWFKVGDSVKVVDDVMKAGANLRGRVGKVIETWEKCEVDPTCCCAEQVDCNMAVRVKFEGDEQSKSMADDASFEHYFAEEELVKVQQPNTKMAATSQTVAFDGMSCMAFKLDHLKLEERPRGIASFEPRRADDES